MYAFCNTHDISWGTKGDDKAPKLDSITIKPDGKVDVTIPKDDGDLNSQYEAEMRKFADKAPKVKKQISASDKQADYYNDFRSSVVLAWMFTNFGLCALVLSTAGLNRVEVGSSDAQRSTIYMNVVLWSVAALSAFRFCGAVWFLIVRRVSLASPFFRRIFTSAMVSLSPLLMARFNTVPRRLRFSLLLGVSIGYSSSPGISLASLVSICIHTRLSMS